MWVTAPPRIDPVMPSTIRLFQAIRMRLKVAGKGLNRCQSLAQSVLRQPVPRSFNYCYLVHFSPLNGQYR
jgi:hypothetical protein